MAEFDDRILAARVRVMQIIGYALIMGVILFLVLATYIVFVQRDGEGLAPPRDLPILSIVAFVMLAIGGVASIVVPYLIVRNNLVRIAAGRWPTPPGGDPTDFQGDTAKLLALRQASLIVSLALLEAPAFMGAFAFLHEAQLYVIAVPAVALVTMLLRIPTESGLREWLARQEQQLNDMRMESHR